MSALISCYYKGISEKLIRFKSFFVVSPVNLEGTYHLYLCFRWVHFHFDNVIQALQMESELKNTFPDGKVHTGEFSPNKDEEGEKCKQPIIC